MTARIHGWLILLAAAASTVGAGVASTHPPILLAGVAVELLAAWQLMAAVDAHRHEAVRAERRLWLRAATRDRGAS